MPLIFNPLFNDESSNQEWQTIHIIRPKLVDRFHSYNLQTPERNLCIALEYIRQLKTKKGIQIKFNPVVPLGLSINNVDIYGETIDIKSLVILGLPIDQSQIQEQATRYFVCFHLDMVKNNVGNLNNITIHPSEWKVPEFPEPTRLPLQRDPYRIRMGTTTSDIDSTSGYRYIQHTTGGTYGTGISGSIDTIGLIGTFTLNAT